MENPENKDTSAYFSDTFRHILEDFCNYKLRSQKTKRNYLLNTINLCNFLQKDFLDIRREDADRYFEYISRQKDEDGHSEVSVRTITARASIFRSIGRFIVTNKGNYANVPEDYSNVFLGLSMGEYSEYVNPLKVPTLEELDDILEEAKDNEMLYLIFTMVIRCALTPNELCSIEAEMVKVDADGRAFLVLKKKNDHVRHVKIPSDVFELFVTYTKHINVTSGLVFFCTHGNTLKYSQLNKYTNAVIKSAGYTYTLKDIRNASIAYMLFGGAAPKDTAEYAGISERWMYKYKYVLEALDKAPCDYQHFKISTE